MAPVAADILIMGMACVRPVDTGQSARDVPGSTGLLLQEQGRHSEPDEMPDSPLREAFELISFYLLNNGEEGIGEDTAMLSIAEQVGIDPDCAISEAVRTGLVEAYSEPVTSRRMIRRGPCSAEMLKRIYGRDGPPTVESIRADVRERRKRREAEEARLEAIREAGRPRGRNTLASLPAWAP